MKKCLSIIMCLALICVMCACSRTAPKETETPAASPETENTPEPYYIPSETGNAFISLLDAVKTDARPGSAGSSLTAVRLAGGILDFVAENSMTAEEISAVSGYYMADCMTEEEADGFKEQLDSVWGGAEELMGENARDAMESAGFEATHYPWDDVEAVFAAIYAGMGLEMP